MATLDYADAPAPVRGDIVAAQLAAWQRIGEAGSLWTGARRVAIAAEVRNAALCAICARRKAALSPFAIDGAHDSAADLLAAAIDVIHRVRTDPGRQTRAWHDGVRSNAAGDGGLSDGEYVEIVIVIVIVVTVVTDTFARAIGTTPWPLPEPVAGEPARIRPRELADEGAYIATIPSGGAGPTEADLYNPFLPNIYCAISLVPDQARLYYAIVEAQYMPSRFVPRLEENAGRAISQAQIELLAARVSALNGCFF